MPILNIRELGSIGVVSDVAPWDLPPAAFSGGINFRLVSGKVQTSGGIEAVSSIAGRDIGHITQSTDLRGNSSWLVCGEDAILLFDGTDFTPLTGDSARLIRANVNVDYTKWTSATIGNVTFFNNPEFNPFYWVDGDSLNPATLSTCLGTLASRRGRTLACLATSCGRTRTSFSLWAWGHLTGSSTTCCTGRTQRSLMAYRSLGGPLLSNQTVSLAH